MATHVRRKAISIDKNEKKREHETNSPEIITPIPIRPTISQLIAVRPKVSTRNVRNFTKVKKLRLDNLDSSSLNDSSNNSLLAVVKNNTPAADNSLHVEINNFNLPTVNKSTLVTHLDTEESVSKINEKSSAQEITRVTLTSFVKAGGNKEVSNLQNMSTVQNDNLSITHGTADDNKSSSTIVTDNNSHIMAIKKNDHSTLAKNNGSTVLNINETKDKNIKLNNKHDTQNKAKNGEEASLNIRNDKNQFPCPVCKRSFSRKFNMQSHLKTHDTERVKPYACTYGSCTLRFTRKHDLKRHINGIHNEQKEFLCPQCNKNFSRKDAWRRHELTCRSAEETTGIGKSMRDIKSLPQLLPAPYISKSDQLPSIIKRRGRPRKLVTNKNTDLIEPIKETTNEIRLGKKGTPQKLHKIETFFVTSTEEVKDGKRERPTKSFKDDPSLAESMEGIIINHTREPAIAETQITEMSVENQLIKAEPVSTINILKNQSINRPSNMVTEVGKDINRTIDSFNTESNLVSFKYHDTSTISSINEVDYAMSEEMTEEAFGELYEETFGEKTKTPKEK